MKKADLFPAWGILFVLCAGLGFLPEPQGAVRIFLTALSVGFFVPPALILYMARREKDRRTIVRIRNLSAASLGITLLLIILNILAALSSEWLGSFLHGMLVIFSAPMVCSGYWALSLFLWACLLTASFHR